MFKDSDLQILLDNVGVYIMECGWQVVIRADLVDRTPQQPHGLDYALILQDERGHRIFGYDNAHAYDGAPVDDCWDHEHRIGLVGQRFRYQFRSATGLMTLFFDTLQQYCTSRGVSSDFIVEDDNG